MSTVELQATCDPMHHAEKCAAGDASCGCWCHGPTLRRHVVRWAPPKADVPGYGVACSCGWFGHFEWQDIAASAVGAHLLEES